MKSIYNNENVLSCLGCLFSIQTSLRCRLNEPRKGNRLNELETI
jgi:hypothetical protein